MLAAFAILAAVLYGVSHYSYLLFHVLVEIFSVAIAWGIFMIAWNTRRITSNHYLLCLGIASLFVGSIDLMHTLAYKGMQVFPWDDPNPATQLWIAARGMQAASFFVALRFLGREINAQKVFGLYLALTLALLASILYFKVFPDCFIEGQGLTPFKKTAEYIISGALAAYLFLMRRYKEQFSPAIYRDIQLAVVFTICAELAFTFYVSVYGFSNLVGHIFKLAAFYFIYRAVIENGLRKPYDLMFLELKRHEESLLVKNAGLSEAIQLAREAEQAKAMFFAKMSHEIRTPVAAIIGMSELALKGNLTQQEREYLETINHSSHCLLTVINDILDMSKLEAGQLKLASKPFSLSQSIGLTVKLLNMRAREKGLALKVTLPSQGSDLVFGDPDRLRQVLINLIGNAIKFTDKGEVRLEVSCTGNQGDSATYSFSIVDTGPGIAAEHHSDLFQEFNLASNLTSGKVEGTELGLSISWNLVAIMGGALTLESAPGKGSTFSFALTFKKATAQDLAAQGVLQHDITTEGGTPTIGKILLVEDNAINQKIATRFLEQAGHSVHVASNGLEAIEHASKAPFDIILMDVNMPQMDGFATTARLRANGVSTPIVALTARAMMDDRQACLNAGMDDYLTKPFNSSELLQVVQRNLKTED